MTDTINVPRAELQEILDAWDNNRGFYMQYAMTRMRGRLAQQEEKPEPVAWAHWDSPSWSEEPITLTVITKPPTKLQKESANWFPLYTAPPKREWQGLTDEEIHRAYQAWFNSESKHERDFVRAIEAKLKEKNDG